MLKEQIKLILFDIGGVLIEYGDVFKTVSIEQKFPHEFIDKTFDKYDNEITLGKITPQELYLKCLDENKLLADRNYNFVDSWLRDCKIIEPTFNLVQQLYTAKKYKIGLFSNIYKVLVPEMIKRNLIPQIRYDYIFLSCDIGMQKPEEQIYVYVQLTTGLKPKQILFVDDKDENLEAASKIGWNTFKFSRKDPDESIIKLQDLILG